MQIIFNAIESLSYKEPNSSEHNFSREPSFYIYF
jgi:hypothetical protein